MRIDYHIDLGRASGGIVDITADFSGVPRGTDLVLGARGGKPAIKVLSLTTAKPGKRATTPAVSGDNIAWPGKDFSLRYSLRIGLSCSVGTGLGSELLYPFINSREIFLGSGALPYPKNLPRLAAGLKTSLRVAGIPPGFRLFSSLGENDILPCQLDSFFMYFSRREPARHVYHGKTGRTEFFLLVQEGKKIPMTRAQVWRHTDMVMRTLEESLSPYGGFRKISVMILQPPENFEELSAGRTFATGENVPGGVLAYAPATGDYIRKRFGHSGYGVFLRDGLAHELTHFYSTAAWQGKYKSLLFPAESCPPRHKRLMGEILTCYFHRAISLAAGKTADFTAEEIRPRLSAWSRKPAKNHFLDLVLLDLWLRGGGSTLKGVVRALIREYGLSHSPYRSAKALVKAAELSHRAKLPPWLERTILGDYFPDYSEKLKELAAREKSGFNPLSN